MKQKNLKINSVYNAIKTVSSILLPLISFPYVSRHLLADRIGMVNFGSSVISYFQMIASLGIATYAIRECSAARGDQDRLNNIASQIFSINVFTTMIAYALLGITLLLYRRLDNYRELIVVQSMSIVFATLGADWLNSAMEDFRYITLRTVAFQLLSLVLILTIVKRPEDYMKYAVINLISSSGANIVNIWYRRKYCRIRFTMKVEWKRHLTPILLLFVMILAQEIFANVDTTMLGLMHGDRAVGIYAAAHKINRIVSQVISSIYWVIMPRMSYYFAKKDYTEINRLLRKLLGFNLLVGLPCVTGLIVMAEDIVLVAAGQDFATAAPVLQIRTLSMFFALFGGNLLGNAVMLPSKNERYYMIVCLITAAVNVIGNALLIPGYGPIGAAMTTAFCSFVILLLLLLKVDRNIRFIRVSRLILSPLAGCAAILIICGLFRGVSILGARVIVSISISILAYGLIQILFKNELAVEILELLKRRIAHE